MKLECFQSYTTLFFILDVSFISIYDILILEEEDTPDGVLDVTLGKDSLES